MLEPPTSRIEERLTLPCELRHDFKRLSLRLEHIVHLDTMATHDNLPESLQAAMASDFEELKSLLHGRSWIQPTPAVDSPSLGKLLLDSIQQADGPFGWLINARQPEFIVVDGGEIHFSWARVRSEWVFAETYEAAVASALDWAETYAQEVWAAPDAGGAH
jgi:hypothetical protein